MITIRTKNILFKLVKEGLMSFELDIENIAEELKSLITEDVICIKEAIMEAFQYEYALTYDNKLTDDNFKKPTLKLITLNLEKMLSDNIFKGYKDYDKLKVWESNHKEEIVRFSNIALFLSALSANGYTKTKENIMDCLEEIRKYTEEIQGSPKDRFDIFSIWFDRLWRLLETLPTDYEYAKEYFQFKTFYNSAQNNKSNIFSSIGRNDQCPCGSGKKFKKCCI